MPLLKTPPAARGIRTQKSDVGIRLGDYYQSAGLQADVQEGGRRAAYRRTTNTNVTVGDEKLAGLEACSQHMS